MEVDEQNQDEDAVADAIGPNVQLQPSVYKLNTDCWDEIFDWLSLEDVHSFSQTSKAFQRVAGQYFQWKYEAVSAFCGRHDIWIYGKLMNGFSEFIQRIGFAMRMDDATLRYIDSNYKAIKQLSIHVADLNEFNVELVEILLRKLEALEIFDCRFDRNIFGTLIESCVNLKRLKFFSGGPFTWPVCKHPTLEHLELETTTLRNGDELKTFLELSPNIRSIEMNVTLFWAIRNSILSTNVELDDLALNLDIISYTGVDVVDLLNDLHQRGFYKRLHFRSSRNQLLNRLLELPQFVTLYTPYGKYIEFPITTNIKELGIYIYQDKAPFNGMNAWANSFINIEHLFVSRPNLNVILSFIHHSIKLRSIEICQFEGNVLDISALNRERKKLQGARQVTIYVDEDIYLATKWATAQTEFNLIKLKRKASHDIIRPHGFESRYTSH